MDISFILVEPAVPENIGASARALKTMGFRNLRLVKPRAYPHEKASWVAHGSEDILENAVIYQRFENAIEDLDLVVATSARNRSVKQDYCPVDHLYDILHDKGTFINKLGVVFGREESGLNNQEIRMCDLISYIPLQQSYPSLNLGQAVMLYAYQLSRFHRTEKKQQDPGNPSSFRTVKEKAMHLLQRIGIPREDARYGRIMERLALLSETDLHLVLSVSNALEDRM